MARGRILSRSLGCSRKFNAIPTVAGPLTEFSQLLYVLLIPHTDDFGRLTGDGQTVRLTVLPDSARTPAEFDRALTILHEVGLILRYRVNDDIWLQVNKFEDHQFSLNKRTKSRIPAPPPGASRNFQEFPGISKNLPELPGTSENLQETPGTSEKFTVARARGTERNGTELKDKNSGYAAKSPNGDGHAADRPGSLLARPPHENYAVILKLVQTEHSEHPDHDVVSLKDAVKERCARAHILYNSEIVGKAIDSALASRKRRRRA